MRSADRYLEPERPKTLRERVKPSVILEKELVAQLTALGLSMDDVSQSSIAHSRRLLEAFLWRDITYFADKGYTDQEIAIHVLQRLRENSLFLDTVKELVEQLGSVDE